MIWSRRSPTSKPPKALCARRAMRCAFSARPTPRSISIVADSHGRSDAGRAEPDRRPDHRSATPRLGCSCSRPTRRRPISWPTSTPCGCWRMSSETDSPAFRVGQPVKVRLSAFPGRVFDGKITTIGATVDPNTRRVLVRSRDQRSAARIAFGHVRQFRHQHRRAGPFPGRAACRRGARGRRHANRLGHRRPPSVHAAHGQDRRAARRLPANSRRPAARRTGRHRRRDLPQQHGDDCGGPNDRLGLRRRIRARGEPC